MKNKKVNIISRRERQMPYEIGVINYIDHSISIAKQITVYLNKYDKNQLWLAEQLNKTESEISKWLTGTHNFTLKTISKVEEILNEKIILCPREVTLVNQILTEERQLKSMHFTSKTVSSQGEPENMIKVKVQHEEAYTYFK